MTGNLELWGGVECTINRVGDTYFDQCVLSGHDKRIDDLDRIASLGIKVLRYPALWEKIAPNGLKNADWSLTDRQLNRLKELGIDPIIGFTHHGSGPQDTNLLDPDFPRRLAEFAFAVAERYPWLRLFTPVNEPNTTARFSALYGHWYPHAHDDASYLRALLHQCQAVVLAMKAVRVKIPHAQLIQTEDMGKTYSTPQLAYQAKFENERRWLSLDILCGRQPGLRMQHYLSENGISQDELAWFIEQQCPPDVVGINHYITSERFLDHRMETYPECYHGGNGRHKYADIEAVRVCDEIDNVHAILREAWRRYQRPISITEALLGDTPEEQQRWLWERWVAALQCRDEGIDVRAVTVWALLGSFYWNCLVTRDNGHYEPGVFDVRQDPILETPVGEMVRALATEGVYKGTDLEQPGWWRRPDRILYPLYKLKQEYKHDYDYDEPIAG